MNTNRGSSKDFAVYTQLMTEFKEGGYGTGMFDSSSSMKSEIKDEI